MRNSNINNTKQEGILIFGCCFISLIVVSMVFSVQLGPYVILILIPSLVFSIAILVVYLALFRLIKNTKYITQLKFVFYITSFFLIFILINPNAIEERQIDGIYYTITMFIFSSYVVSLLLYLTVIAITKLARAN